MLKKLLWTGAAIIALLIVAVALLVLYIDHIARVGIESGAGYALGVRTTLNEADVGLLSGDFALAGLTVTNPEGFEASDHFMSLASGRAAVTLGSLMRQRIVVRQIELSGLDLVLEKRGDSANYRVIMDNLERLRSGEKAEPPPAEGGGKTFIVEEIVIRDISVTAYLVQVGGQAPRPVRVMVPEVRMRYGSDKGVTIHQMSALILQAVMTSVVTNAGELLPGVIVDGLSDGLNQLASLGEAGVQVVGGAGRMVGEMGRQAAGALGEVGGDVAEGVGQAAGDAGRSAGEAGKRVGEGLNKVGEGIGGLLGGKDRQDSEEDGN